VGTGEKVFVSCFIMASRMRMISAYPPWIVRPA
jgi:hypothetical protein